MAQTCLPRKRAFCAWTKRDWSFLSLLDDNLFSNQLEQLQLWRCSCGWELVLTDDIRHADPLLNSKVFISSERSIPTAFHSATYNYRHYLTTIRSFLFGEVYSRCRAHLIRYFSRHRSPPHALLFEIITLYFIYPNIYRSET